MYKVQIGNRWEGREGRIVAVGDVAITVEDDAGVRASIPVTSVQGWVYDPTPVASTKTKPVELSLSEGVGDADAV